MFSLADRRLYGIVDLGYVEPHVEAVTRATKNLLEGGIDILQLRAKVVDEDTILELGRIMLPLTRAAGVPLIINDFPHITAELDADGVHLGQDDGDVATARDVIGEDKIVGRSTNSRVQAIAAKAEGADYIGFGPIFATPTKPGRSAIGSQDIADVHRQLGDHFPIYCIGGIKNDNAATLVAAGARRLVIVSGLLLADDIPAYIGEIKHLLPSIFQPQSPDT